MQAKWRVKVIESIEAKIPSLETRTGAVRIWLEKCSMFILPFITVLREGIEAVVFIAGVTFHAPSASVPLPTVTGLAVGCFIGYLIYRYVIQHRVYGRNVADVGGNEGEA